MVERAQLFRAELVEEKAAERARDGVGARTGFEGEACAERAAELGRFAERDHGRGFLVRGCPPVGAVEIGRLGDALDEAAGQGGPRDREVPSQRHAEQAVTEGRCEHVGQFVAQTLRREAVGLHEDFARPRLGVERVGRTYRVLLRGRRGKTVHGDGQGRLHAENAHQLLVAELQILPGQVDVGVALYRGIGAQDEVWGPRLARQDAHKIGVADVEA